MGTFSIAPDFRLNGQPFQILSGSIHYFRVHPAYWRDRLAKLIAMGCNTVETYLPWNAHEPKKGVFDFGGRLDVVAFVRLAEEMGLKVILRPSPYICAEWEFGGLPAWLLKEDGIRLRCRDPRYMRHVLEYYDVLMPLLAPLQITHGGPVILMQVENEYGSYGDDQEYLQQLKQAMLDRGIDVPLVTSDGPEPDMIACGRADGVFATCNFGSGTVKNFRFMDQHGIRPKMCMEYWCGWFDHWGDSHKTPDPEASALDFAELVRLGHVNCYMFHGGTNFGLMNGSNDFGKLEPDVTSYDYDAPLSEDGRVTRRYHLFRQAIADVTGVTPPELVEESIPRFSYGQAKPAAAAPLLPLIFSNPKHELTAPVSMERLDQSYGYIAYRRRLTNEPNLRELRLNSAADRVHVLLNGRIVATRFDRELEQPIRFDPPLTWEGEAELVLLVENMGRVNYGYRLEQQRKGIDGGVFANGHQLFGWDAFSLDEADLACAAFEPSPLVPNAPSIHRFTFRAEQIGDTWLELPNWGKGTASVNGFLLGRYWDIGPQRRLYIPAPLLREGENELLITETEGSIGEVWLKDEPMLG